MKSKMKRLSVTLTLMLTAFMVNAQSCPDDNHPHAIDLGLPSGTQWACCNVGATIPEDDGGHYAWGETEEKGTYDWGTYIYCDGSLETCHNLGSDIADTEYDVAHVQWGGGWMMPSNGQVQELLTQCSCTSTTKNGIEGALFTGPSGESIFLPAAGLCDTGGLGITDSDGLNSETDELPIAGYYWSSTQHPSNSCFGSYLLFSYDSSYFDCYVLRCNGLTVRPVISATTTKIHPKSSADSASPAVFDLSGRRLGKEPQKGVYICNGKKVVR